MEIWKKKISRREFIKMSVLGVAGIGLAFTAMNFMNPLKIAKAEAPEKLWKWSKEAYYYKNLGNATQCQLCPNRCLLQENRRGFCRVRVNKDGKLYTLVYGNPCAVHVDPVEKKPLFHFLPGSKSFSIATAGCNFRCLNCQNWEISQRRPEDTENIELFPEDVVLNAKKHGCESIAYTYSEPSIFYEYMYDTAKLARKNGLRNQWITNGYLNEKPIRDLCKYLDAANIDLKSFDEEIYNKLNAGHLEPVLNTLKLLKEENVWFEITNLIVPTYTDKMEMIKEMCDWIIENVGLDYPLHFSRFYPMYKLTALPQTPVKILEEARKIALKKGLHYVYIGNVPGHKAQNTYCHNCGNILIERNGYIINQYNLENGNCKYCGEKIPGVWK